MTVRAVRAAPGRVGSGAFFSDKQHRSADHETWVPRCPGCLPEDVRPHRCVGWLDGHGWHCHCDDDLCREMAKKIWRLKREATAKQIADLQRELLERHLITREDAQQLGLFG